MCDIQVSEGDVDAPAMAPSLSPKLRLYFILMTAEQSEALPMGWI